MLTKTKMQEIQDLKLQGYTKADIIRYYEAQGRAGAQASQPPHDQ